MSPEMEGLPLLIISEHSLSEKRFECWHSMFDDTVVMSCCFP